MKLPLALHGTAFFRRKRFDGDEPARSASDKSSPLSHPIRRAHGLESHQRFFLDTWLHSNEEK